MPGGKVTTKLLNIGLVACQRGHRSADALLLLKKSSNPELLETQLGRLHKQGLCLDADGIDQLVHFPSFSHMAMDQYLYSIPIHTIFRG